MVMFHRLPYREALDRGGVQSAILSHLTKDADHPDEVDWQEADTLVKERLAPFPGP